jgi:hypothetical protein
MTQPKQMNKKEIVKFLKWCSTNDAIDAWNSWKENQEGELDLSYSNLKYLNLKGIDLSLTDLTESNLKGANLKGANLIDANLTDVNLKEANLSHINLNNATIEGKAKKYLALDGVIEKIEEIEQGKKHLDKESARNKEISKEILAIKAELAALKKLKSKREKEVLTIKKEAGTLGQQTKLDNTQSIKNSFMHTINEEIREMMHNSDTLKIELNEQSIETLTLQKGAHASETKKIEIQTNEASTPPPIPPKKQDESLVNTASISSAVKSKESATSEVTPTSTPPPLTSQPDFTHVEKEMDLPNTDSRKQIVTLEKKHKRLYTFSITLLTLGVLIALAILLQKICHCLPETLVMHHMNTLQAVGYSLIVVLPLLLSLFFFRESRLQQQKLKTLQRQIK